MLDRLPPTDADAPHPAHQPPLDPARLGAVLCIAPHPDDETLGPGGLLARLAALGAAPQVLILTHGGAAAPGAPLMQPAAESLGPRAAESIAAARALGLAPPWYATGLPDGGLRYSPALIERLAAVLDAFRPQTLLLPALSEPHPDHQAVALAGLAAVQQRLLAGQRIERVLGYEVGAPTDANAWVDISDLAERKWAAIGAYSSQLAQQPYLAQAQALAALRAFGHPGCRAAEAYVDVPAAALLQNGPAAAAAWWPLTRRRRGLAVEPQELPRVAVLIRSMDRDCLADALASVAAQTYPHVEVVVLNASARPHRPLPMPAGDAASRLVERLIDPAAAPTQAAAAASDDLDGPAATSSATTPCGRARAGNQLLDAAIATGAPLLLFLDDDDLLLPTHIERLVAALQDAPHAVAAYAGVRVLDATGQPVRDYDLPWAPERLAGINFLPIHAVLFRRTAAQSVAARFDDSLPVLEDWDFWRQLAAAGPFVHVPGISAIYRQGQGHSQLGDPSHPNHWAGWHRQLLERAVRHWPPAQAAAVLAWHAVQLDAALAERERLRAQAEAEREQLLAQAEAERAQLLAQAEAERAMHAHTRALLQAAEAQLAAVYRSRSWRLTRPLRALTAWLHGQP